VPSPAIARFEPSGSSPSMSPSMTFFSAEEPVMMSPASMTALLALTQVDAVLLWDPTNATLIAGNIVGEWINVD